MEPRRSTTIPAFTLTLRADPRPAPPAIFPIRSAPTTQARPTFPSTPPSPTASFAGSEPFGATAGLGLVDTHLRTPYVYQYSLNIQQQLPGGMVLESGYVGDDAHKLTSLVDVNPFPLGSNTRLYNPDSTNSLFSNLLEYKNVGVANYNALQVSVTRRYANTKAGSAFYTFAYTWPHELDN